MILKLNSCAGLCSYRRNKKYCCIRLSAPLLKLRPHSDLVNTLLHEMIHAYLFLTNKDETRDGHGPNFHNHKDRINKDAGTNITVYHSFHSEVKLYKQHWWRCNGQCQNSAPFFGMVKRSMNRAPGPNYRWWSGHQVRCGGSFIKIREPVEYTRKKNKNKYPEPESGKKFGLENIVGFVDLTSFAVPAPEVRDARRKRNGVASVVGVIDLTDEPSQKKSKDNEELCQCPTCDKIIPRGSVSEHLENCESLQDIFDLDSDDSDTWENEDTNSEESVDSNSSYQSCPICASQIEDDLKSHVEDCLSNSGIVNVFDEQIEVSDCQIEHEKSGGRRKKVGEKYCPICGSKVYGDLEIHVNSCLNSDEINSSSSSSSDDILEITDYDPPGKNFNSKTKVPKNHLYSNDETKLKNNSVCPVCSKTIKKDFNLHVNDCLNTSLSSSDFDDPIVDISDCESPVKDLKKQTASVIFNPAQSKPFKIKPIMPTNKKCPDDSCFIVDLEERVFEISDSESPVKILDSKCKIPMPKVLSERRIACRICGMRFGISQFNGHVCYPS